MTRHCLAPTCLHVIGAFDLRQHGESLGVPRPAERLLAFLAFQRGPLPRQTAAVCLWPDADDRQAAARLRSTLWRLPAPEGRRLVSTDAGQLQLAAHVAVDVRLAEQEDAERATATAVDLRGDVLAHWDDEWVVVERERFRQLRLHRLERLSEVAMLEGRYGDALQSALTAVAAEPLRESAHRRVIEAHLGEGNNSEALRQFDSVRRLLRDELGIAPAPVTRALVADLLGRPLDPSGGSRAARARRTA